LYHKKLIEAAAYSQHESFSAGVQFARAEGIIPAPESAYAIQQTIKEALVAREEGKNKVILFNLSGHGLLDLSAYEAFLNKRF
jgi:tryptophan synthase beta chain